MNVTKRFRDTIAVADLSLTIDHGTYCCLLGPERLRQDDDPAHDRGPRERRPPATCASAANRCVGLDPVQRGTAMMFQSYALFPHRSVLDNVGFALKMRGASREARTRDGARAAGKGPYGTLRQPPAGGTVGRPAATRGAGPRADHQPARAAAR